MSRPIEHHVTLDATPARIYRALMDSAQHAAFTGGPAEIGAEAGSAFTCHGGAIEGRTIELVPDRRIVQAWRVAAWPAGVYSVVWFELAPEGDQTALTLVHTGVPEAGVDAVDSGWTTRYWEPLKRWLQ